MFVAVKESVAVGNAIARTWRSDLKSCYEECEKRCYNCIYSQWLLQGKTHSDSSIQTWDCTSFSTSMNKSVTKQNENNAVLFACTFCRPLPNNNVNYAFSKYCTDYGWATLNFLSHDFNTWRKLSEKAAKTKFTPGINCTRCKFSTLSSIVKTASSFHS